MEQDDIFMAVDPAPPEELLGPSIMMEFMRVMEAREERDTSDAIDRRLVWIRFIIYYIVIDVENAAYPIFSVGSIKSGVSLGNVNVDSAGNNHVV